MRYPWMWKKISFCLATITTGGLFGYLWKSRTTVEKVPSPQPVYDYFETVLKKSGFTLEGLSKPYKHTGPYNDEHGKYEYPQHRDPKDL